MATAVGTRTGANGASGSRLSMMQVKFDKKYFNMISIYNVLHAIII